LLLEVRQYPHRDTAPLDRCRSHLIVLREAQGARRLDGANLHRIEPEIPFGHPPSVADRLVIEPHVVREIGG